MKKYSKFISLIAIIVVLGITVGYAALGSEMSISGVVAEIRLKKDIRVTDFSYSSSTSSASTSSVEYSNKALLTDIILPNNDSTVTYKVEVTNFGNVEMGIYELTGLPDNLTYEVTDYTLKEKICDTSNACSSGISKTFYVTIKYVTNGYSSTNTVYSLDMKVDFRQFYTISYDSSITNNGYPSEIIGGDNLVITFTDSVPSDISIYSDGLVVDNSLYEYKNGTLKYNNISGHIVIKEAKTFVSMMSNEAVLDNDIDFGSSDGLNVENNIAYVMSGTEDDKYPIYYYRGYVTKNNVIFANFCWKIVRTTETGGTKLIYNGVPASDGSCNNTGEESTIGASVFNSNSLSPADVGYMYGTRYESASIDLSSQSETYLYGNDISWDGTNYTLQDTYSSTSWSSDRTTLATKYHYTCLNSTGVCSSVYYIHYFGYNQTAYYLTFTGGKTLETAKDAMFTNTTNSTIKTAIDNWYKANMTSYTNKLENAIWCNDRNIITGGLKGKDESATSNTEFETYYRNSYSPYEPSIECTNQNDSFTLKVESGGTSGYGNNALTYPVGLLTSDELTLAGHGSYGHNYNGELDESIKKGYLYLSNYPWWTMSPRTYYEGRAYLEILNGDSYGDGISGTSVNNKYDNLSVRPAVVLKNGIEFQSGDGTVNNPYVVID